MVPGIPGTLVAVHKDKDHIHCHLVTNSVSYEDGKKLHTMKRSGADVKQFTNQMPGTWADGCRKRKTFDGSRLKRAKSLHGARINIICSGNKQKGQLLCRLISNGGVKSTGELYQ